MSEPGRKVLHIDCDCFFAAVEMREQPHLRDVPIAIGGDRGLCSKHRKEAERQNTHAHEETFRHQGISN